MKTRINSKIAASLVGLIVGVIIIFIGISVMNPDTYLLGKRDSLGSLIEFGGDYQTEMYNMTYQVGHQVQIAYVNICNAIGWLIIAIGAFDICFFLRKMFDFDSSENVGAQIETASVPSAANSISGASDEKPNAVVSSKTVNPCPPAVATEVKKWVCDKCQTENSTNYSQCKKCGNFRSNSVQTVRELTEKEKLDGYWFCEKCYTKNLNSRETCWGCDSAR
jgi:ribosomal protein L40E